MNVSKHQLNIDAVNEVHVSNKRRRLVEVEQEPADQQQQAITVSSLKEINEKKQSLRFEALVLHSSLAGNLHRRVLQCSSTSDNLQETVETCLNHYKQVVKFHSLLCTPISAISHEHAQQTMQQMREVQSLQQYVGQLQCELCYCCMPPASFGNDSSLSDDSNPNDSNNSSNNSPRLHFFTDILTASENNSSNYSNDTMNAATNNGNDTILEKANHHLFAALFNMSSIYHGQQGGETSQMSYLLLSKALSLLQARQEKLELLQESRGIEAIEAAMSERAPLENRLKSEEDREEEMKLWQEYELLVQNNMAVLLSDTFQNQEDALEVLEEGVFKILEEEEDENDEDKDDDEVETSVKDEENASPNDTENAIGEEANEETCRRVSFGDSSILPSSSASGSEDEDDSSVLLLSLEEVNQINHEIDQQKQNRKRRKNIKAIILLNSSRIHYRCGLYQDSAELYRQYALLKFHHRVRGNDGIIRTTASEMSGMGEIHNNVIIPTCVTTGEAGEEEDAAVTGCIAAAAA